MTWLRSGEASLVWVLEAVRIWFGIFGLAAAGWTVGFGMGYRRGVNDALIGSICKADHRLNED